MITQEQIDKLVYDDTIEMFGKHYKVLEVNIEGVLLEHRFGIRRHWGLFQLNQNEAKIV